MVCSWPCSEFVSSLDVTDGLDISWCGARVYACVRRCMLTAHSQTEGKNEMECAWDTAMYARCGDGTAHMTFEWKKRWNENNGVEYGSRRTHTEKMLQTDGLRCGSGLWKISEKNCENLVNGHKKWVICEWNWLRHMRDVETNVESLPKWTKSFDEKFDLIYFFAGSLALCACVCSVRSYLAGSEKVYYVRISHVIWNVWLSLLRILSLVPWSQPYGACGSQMYMCVSRLCARIRL